MKKKLIILSTLVLALFALTTYAMPNTKIVSRNEKDNYFTFDSPKKITFSNADAKKIAKDLVLVDREGQEFYPVTNVIDSFSLAISPITKSEHLLKVKGVDLYSVSDYDKTIYVQNQKNLDNIAKSLSSAIPVTYLRIDEMAEGSNSTKQMDTVKQETAFDETANNQDYSKTNIQTEGVDEADIVKTDGKNIYYVRDDKVSIVSADPKNMKVLSTIEKKDSYGISEIYLDSDTLTIFYQQNKNKTTKQRFGYEYMQTNIETYDVSNPKKPTLTYSFSDEGRYVESRKQGDIIYIVTQYSLNVDYNEGMDIRKDSLPEPKISADGEILDKMIYLPFTPSLSITNISTINSKKSTANCVALQYMGSSDNMYMSQKNIYLSTMESPSYNYRHMPITSISKFALKNMGNSGLEYIGSAKIKGRPVNQFAFNEKDGNLFVAYTIDDWTKEDQPSENRLASFDKDMKMLSEVKNLALDEKIYSTRYIDDKAYIVTFKEVDPLFVIDIKNPKNMKVLGYLKVPGYSDYLHPYKNDFLIGFGYDTNQKDNGAIVNSGYKVSLFDIKDFENPKQIDTLIIGQEGTYSPLSYDHKSLMFDYNRDIFAFPVQVAKTVKKNDMGESYDISIPVFDGVYALGVSEKGLNFKGKITHLTAKEQNEAQSYINDYQKQIQRAVQIKDTIYTLANGGIKATDINTFKQQGYISF